MKTKTIGDVGHEMLRVFSWCTEKEYCSGKKGGGEEICGHVWFMFPD